jgi:alkylation response protein AidB-like acyl-CoA dehydrogenase
MGVELEAIEPHLDHTANEWSRSVDHRARWAMKLLVANRHAMEGSWRVVDAALDLTGGAGIVRRAEIERLFRDARVGRVQAGYARFTHDLVGRMLLGLPLDDATASRA